jgi:aminotransferase
MSYTADRLKNLEGSTILEISHYAHRKGAASLSAGAPDFDPPPELIESANRAMRDGRNQYSMPWGIPELRQAIAEKYRNAYGLEVDPDRHVTVTCGAGEAILLSLMAILNPGNRVILLEPFHEAYGPCVEVAGGTPIGVALSRPEYRFDPDELERAFRGGAKAIILNSPHNPTGRVFTEEEIGLVATLSEKYDTVVFSDEIYEHILYDGRRHIPFAGLDGVRDRTITISGMSKTFAITGWRLGYVVAPETVSNKIRAIHEFTIACAPTPLQYAMLAALGLPDSYYRGLTEFYTARRDRVIGILRKYGFKTLTPEGSFYTMADFTGLGRGDDDVAFAYWLIDHAGVATVPGSCFYRSDPSCGRGTVRIAYPKKDETLDGVEERFARSL